MTSQEPFEVLRRALTVDPRLALTAVHFPNLLHQTGVAGAVGVVTSSTWRGRHDASPQVEVIHLFLAARGDSTNGAERTARGAQG